MVIDFLVVIMEDRGKKENIFKENIVFNLVYVIKLWCKSKGKMKILKNNFERIY